ncbi:hypothetical protein [Paenibacillus sp. PL91]|uniref:hypothetical protein n=1 Tax=Paenibacillus sp. PL91 TaxID=2729538 RepID=UPI00145F2564|nr:hypothetical protein [Paenibacillus sp. PL91]MBC9204719.1 hypothetical protein [Paenibacillus sp. PL91]
MKPTDAVPGKPYVLKMKKDEDPLIFQWLNMQGIYSDSIRYLIEKEIAENGLRNLQHFIPSKRNIHAMKEQIHFGSGFSQANYTEHHNFPMHNKAAQVAAEVEIRSNSINNSFQDSDIIKNDIIKISNNDTEDTTDSSENNTEMVNAPNYSEPKIEPKVPRKAGKKFDDDVLNSYR